MPKVTVHYRKDTPEQCERNYQNFCHTMEWAIQRTYGLSVTVTVPAVEKAKARKNAEKEASKDK